MFRRLSSLRRVAVDRSLSLFHGEAKPPLRYYPDAKTSHHPSRRASFSFAWRYHGCADRFAPMRCRRAVRWAGVLFVGGHPKRRRVIRGDDRISQVPAEPSVAMHMLLRPRKNRTGLATPSRRHGPGNGNVQGFFNCTFEAQSHGLATDCLRFAVPVARQRRKTRLRLLAKLYRAGFGPAEFYREVSVMCRSHRILLSRACLAQSLLILLSL